MSTTYFLCLVVGHEDGTLTAWNGANEDGLELALGNRIELLIDNDDPDSEALVAPAEVAYLSTTDEGNHFAILYTHEDDTTESMEEKLGMSGWDAADGEMLLEIEAILEGTSTVASTHLMYLVSGSLEDPENIRIWKRALEPSVADVPVFGDRFYTQLFFSDLQEGEFTEAFNPKLEDDDRDRVYIDEVVDINAGGDLENGFPVIVFQSVKVDYGVALLSLYTPSLEPFDDFSLASDGWEAVTRDELDPVEEKVAERINLALRTRVLLDTGTRNEDNDMVAVSDYEIIDAETVPEEHYELLPSYLVAHIAMKKELDEISDSLDEWKDDGHSSK